MAADHATSAPPTISITSTMQLKPINAPPLDEASMAAFHVAATLGGSPTSPTLHVAASPGTDLWHKPPSPEVYTAPCYVYQLPVSTFHRARVTVRANWTRQYDQGGLVLFLPGLPPHSLWVKTGIEFVDGIPSLSTVAARNAADWSLLPLSEKETSVTIEIEREEVNEGKGTGASLWVYLIEGEKRRPLREMTWVFAEKADLAGLISVGIYAARPTRAGQNDKESLVVTFDDLTIV